MKKKIIQPLKLSDTISLLAPSGAFSYVELKKRLSGLEDFPFQWSYAKNLLQLSRYQKKNSLPYLAGSDELRALELEQALLDPKAKAILFVRGGYGTQRLLPLLTPIKKVPGKVVMGSSDLTILLFYLWKKFKMKSVYGPMVLPHIGDKKNKRNVIKMLLNEGDYFQRQKVVGKELIVSEKSKEGQLLGGCLSLLISSLGTDWEIDTKDSLLFLEDVNEPPYKVDRMLTQLLQSGKLDDVHGFIFGTFKWRDQYFPREILDVIKDRLKPLGKPILWGVPFGHHHQPLMIPFGGCAEIHKNELKIREGIYES